MLTRQRQQAIGAQITSSTNQNKMDSCTLGTVVDTNDPQQMGRVRAVCQRWGDSFTYDVEHIPWALYVPPFGGSVHTGTRGPGIDEVDGSTSYGMWAIPKVGAQVLVMCVDSDPNQRVYIGCVYDQFATHTLPHGRFMYDDHPNLDNSMVPAGPYSSNETAIKPTWDNMRQAFANKKSPEWQTRGADYTVAALDIQNLDTTRSKVADDKDITTDGWKSTQGYSVNRTDPTAPSVHTAKNIESSVVAITSPGMHAISMDDRIENSRIRIRTTAGHQIIMDDTNERIYISTARGENWIEMDQAGNIDIFTSNKLNVSAKQGINFTTEKDIRFTAGQGIHMVADEVINIQAKQDINATSQQNVRIEANQSAFLSAVEDVHIAGGSNLNLSADMNLNLNTPGSLIQTASVIHQNGPAATPAQPAAAKPAKLTNRVPTHEPFPRTMTKDDYSHVAEFDASSTSVGRVERGVHIPRGLYWRR